MDESLFCGHLEQFLASHGIPTDIPARLEKLTAEVLELWEADMAGADLATIAKEAADVANVAFSIMLAAGVKSPLWEMFKKLEEVAARPHYVEMRRTNNAR